MVATAPAAVTGDGTRTRLKAVPAELRRKPTLSDTLAAKISQLAVRAEQVFGSPQDIEWAISADKIWLLQSRPITAITPISPANSIVAPPPGQHVLFKPIFENFSEPFSPLAQVHIHTTEIKIESRR